MSASGQTIHEAMRRSVGWTVATAVLAYALADQSFEFLVLLGAGTGVAWWAAVHPGRPAPVKAINAGLLGVVGLGGLQMLRLGFTVNAFAYFIGLLLVVKLFDLRRGRDWGQALVLVTALYVSAVLTSNSMGTGVLLVVGAVLHLRAILRYQIYAAAERGGQSARAVSKVLRRDLRSLQFAGGAAILVIAAVMFVILPRNLGSEAFGSWGAMPVGQTTGYTDEVQLGGPGLISQSQTPVMDITVLDRDEQNRGRPDSAPIYLRGAVLDAYEAGRWTRDHEASRRSMLRPQFIPSGTTIRPWISAGRDPWDIELRVTLRNSAPGTSPMFTVWQPLELRPVNSGQFIAHDPSTGIVERQGSGGRIEYMTRSFDPRFTVVDYPEQEIEPATEPGTESEAQADQAALGSEDQTERRAEAPPAAPERSPIGPGELPQPVAAYARQVLEDAEIDPDPATRPIRDDIRAIRSLENHLQSAFRYTLMDEPVPPGREPTVWFLTERREGHCEYYASALALMARSVGINARVVTGYVASDFNEVTGQYVVRESNAHGWVEAEIAPNVWRTFDGTPPADFYQIHQPAPSLWRSVKKLYETVEFAWVTGVVGFDTDSQRKVLGSYATDFGLKRFGGMMIERLRAGGSGLLLRAVAVAGIVFCISASIGLLLIHQRSALSRLRAFLRAMLARPFRRIARGPADWPERLHAQTLRALAAAGRPKPASRPLRAHLATTASDLPAPLAEALSQSCELLYRVRFGREPAEDAGAFRRASDAIRASENRDRARARQPR